jgi:hypothetical protein
MKTYFNEDVNRCFFVVYFTGDVLASGAGFDFFVAFNLADLATIQNRWTYPGGGFQIDQRDTFVPI